MTTDRYTKVVLTIIAVSLAVIALQYMIPSAFAQNTYPVKVFLCDPTNPNWCADIGRSGGLVVEVKN
jgi:hypothetical protein